MKKFLLERPIPVISSVDQILSLPLDDLIRVPLLGYGCIFRREELPGEQHLEAFDHVLRYKLAYLLIENADVALWKAERDAFLKLVPHSRAKELEPWSTRWKAFGDSLLTAIRRREEIQRQRPVWKKLQKRSRRKDEAPPA